jgi:hypothetical protein
VPLCHRTPGRCRDVRNDLIADAKAEVSHALSKQDASTIRRVLRQLGYTFTAKPGEQPEPPPTPPEVISPRPCGSPQDFGTGSNFPQIQGGQQILQKPICGPP